MKASDDKKFIYEKSPLIETVCQLRFPAILSIEAHEPADFQDTIRENFPRYSVQTEQVAAAGGRTQTAKNHCFISADGSYKLNLSKNFIALSTMRYTSWEDFAAWLDEPLGQFIRIYKPAYFERVGLRYVNGISRERLSLTEYRWNDLLQPQYLGVLDDDEVDESKVMKCSLDTEMKLSSRCALKLHAGPGLIRRALRTQQGVQTIPEKEIRFIFDQDVYAAGNIALAAAAEVLEEIHSHADKIFSQAITDTLHNAMEPTYLI